MAQNFKVDTLQLTKQQVRASGGNSMLYVNGVEVTAGVSGNLTLTGVELGNSLSQTGAALIQRDLDISGVVWNYANATGSYLYSQLTGSSGVLNTKIVNTGQAVLTATTNNSINLSGNLFATGSGLYAMQTGMSGALKDLIGAASAGVATLNALSGVVNIIGDGNVTVTTQGQNIRVSGQDISLYSQYTVYTTGAQVISGNKTFAEDTRFLGHVDVSGEIAFDINNTGAVIDGEIDWDKDYDTLKVGTANFEQHVGFDTYYRVKANSTISKGQVVMAQGTVGNSEFILAGPATNIGPSGELIMGIAAENMATNDFGNVISFGPLKGVDTTPYAAGTILYYDPTKIGGLTGVAPSAPNAKVLMAIVLNSASNGNIFVRVTAGSSLGGTDSNVAFSGLTSGDFIVYGSDGIWHNQVPTTGNISGMSAYALVSNLALTGSTLDGKINSLSGFVAQVSGGLETRITATGNAAVTQANSIGQTISGNLTSTGSTLFLRDSGISGGLEVRIAATGADAVTYANGVGTNLSGNLTTTGQTLDNKINSLSGFVTGSFSGTIEGRIAATGAAAIAYTNSVGQIISGNLTTTGSTLDSKINSLSGFVGQVSGGLEARISQTGVAAVNYTNSVGSIISGNLTTTGTLLSAIKVTGSNILNMVNVTGVGTVTTFVSGSNVYVSGSNSDAVNISGAIASTGQQAWTAANNNAINLSGNLTITGSTLDSKINSLSGFVGQVSGGLEARITQTGNAAVSQANSIGVTISGNLTTTGSTLDSKINSLSGFVGNVSGGLEARISQTGNAAVLYANSIGSATSGSLTTTGTLLSAVKITGSSIINVANFTGVGSLSLFTSGATIYITGSNSDAINLSGTIASTGQQAWTAANNNAINLSGNLTQTGVTLRALTIGGDTNLSGNLTTTGQTLDNKINTLSGFVTGLSGGLEARIALTGLSGMVYANGIGISLSGSLASTGQQAWTAANNNAINLSGNLTATGSTLFLRDSGISGVLDAKIVNTGTAAVTQANSIGNTISGNLTQTGVTLINRDNSISGVLQGYIDALAGGTGSISRDVVYTSGTQYISGTKYFIGNTYIDNLFVTGKQIVVNTQDVYVDNNWIVLNATGGARDSAIFVSTGVTGIGATGGIIGFDVPSMTWVFGTGIYGGDLVGLPKIASLNDITSASGGLEARITATGNAAVAQANSIGQTISGNLTTTGSTLDSKINSLSGFVGVVSGGLETRITLTGNAAVAQANSIGSTISGNLTTTGQTLDSKINSLSGFVGIVSGGLEARITATGNAAVTQANSIGQTISGNLTSTGTLLSAVKITGSSTINVANFTGVGTLSVFTSGATIYITGSNSDAINLSGSIASTGQQAWTAANNNGINLSGNLTQTGVTLRALTIGGDTNLSGNLTTTGSTLDSKINSLSGFVGNVSGGLEARIALTGLSGMIYANGIGTNLSGNLVSTGSLLSAVKITGSSTINVANFTGVGSVSLFTSGALIYVTGSNADAINLSGVIASTGQQAWTAANNNGINLSGNLTQTGISLISYSNGIGTNLSGNLTTTGSTLYVMITGMSGQANTNYATQTNLASTGSTLDEKINSVSGWTNTVFVHRTGDEFISGLKTFTGSNTNFRGANGSFISIAPSNANITMFSTGGYAGNYIYSSNVPPYTIFYRSSGDVINAPLATQNGQAMGYISWRGYTGAASVSADTAYIGVVANSYFDTGNIGGHMIFGTSYLSGVSAGVTTASERMRITSEGKVGIGTATPAENLHVTGAIRSNTAYYSGTTNLADIFATKTDVTTTGSTLNNKINSVSGWTDSVFVHRTGAELISGSKTFVNDTFINGVTILSGTPSAKPTSGFNGTKSLRIGQQNASVLDFGQDGASPFGQWLQAYDNRSGNATTFPIILNPLGGRVGIGLNNYNPGTILDVVGNARVSGVFYVTSFDSTKGGQIALQYAGVDNANTATAWNIDVQGATTNNFRIFAGGDIVTLITTGTKIAQFYGTVRADSGFFSGTTNIANILYPHSNPSGYTAVKITGSPYSAINLTGVGSASVFISGSLVYISGNTDFMSNSNATNLSGNLTQTGVTLGSQIQGLSGVLEGLFVHRTGDELVTGIKQFKNGISIGTYDSGYLYQSDPTGSITVRVGSGASLSYYTFTHSGRFNIWNGGLYSAGLAEFNNDIVLSNGTDQYLYYDNALHIARVGVGDRITISTAGNVGIANTNPLERLHISGNQRIDGNSYVTGRLNVGTNIFTSAFQVHSYDVDSVLAFSRNGVGAANTYYGYFGLNNVLFGSTTDNLYKLQIPAGADGGHAFYRTKNGTKIFGYGINGQGFFGIGSGTTKALAPLVVSQHPSGAPLDSYSSGNGQVVVHIAQDEARAAAILIDTIQGAGLYETRRAEGTYAVRSGILFNTNLGGFGVRGYVNGVNAYSSNRQATIFAYSTENWTGSSAAQYTGLGTYIGIAVTPTGTDTPKERLNVYGDRIEVLTNLKALSGTYDVGNVAITANYTILGSESRIYCNNTNPITVTFPNANTVTGYVAKIKLMNTGIVTFTGTFGQNFDGSPSYVALGQYNSYELHSYNQNWNLW